MTNQQQQQFGKHTNELMSTKRSHRHGTVKNGQRYVSIKKSSGYEFVFKHAKTIRRTFKFQE